MMIRNLTLGLTASLFLSLVAASQDANVALHKPVAVSSEAPGMPAANLVDGVVSRNSKWEAANGRAPHVVEINLQKYYTVREIKVYSGLLDQEKKPGEMNQAAGFFSIKNFRLQYWDDANWSDLPQSEVHENRNVENSFHYNPGVSTYKIRLVCDDGEPISIMEIEVLGSATPNMPAPPSLAPSVSTTAVPQGPQAALLTVSPQVVGKSMKYVGYNQGYYMPGSNISGWVRYSNVNAFRVWASLNSFVPQSAVQVDPGVTSVAEFDRRKATLRKAPEHNAFLKWNELLPLYDKPDSSSTNAMVYNYALGELKKLGVDIILQINSTDFEDNWASKWKQWQRYYALAYYSARKGDVTMFALQNEPNHRNSGPMKLDTWILAMQVVSDAVHCAVADVNKAYGKKLVAEFVGPVTAGQNTDWWTAVAKNMRTDYHGNKLDKDLLEIFSTHSYNSPAAGYETRVENIRNLLTENHPAHVAPPIVFTEIGRWMNAYLIDKDETMDSPSLFTEWAGIYANNMKNGSYGMWAFKFANTASGQYPRGIKSGHHFIWQGKRIVEDAYTNLAAGKPVTSSGGDGAGNVTDGDKSDHSAWQADSSSAEKWVRIDLGSAVSLGSAVVYTGSDGGVYTSPDRVRNFRLQYLDGNTWKNIPGAVEKDNKYAQVFDVFDKPVTTTAVRFFTTDKATVKVREIKLFGEHDGPSADPDFDVSGIQRTGEVVRLFAKGFKNERPLYATKLSVQDAGVDSYTSFDAKTGNYYMWLVQRGLFSYRLTVDLSALKIPAGAVATAELVDASHYGEVAAVKNVPAGKKLELELPAQSVMLVTISAAGMQQRVLAASAVTSVQGGAMASAVPAANAPVTVQLDAAQPVNNHVAYLQFNLPATAKTANRTLLKVNGATDKSSPFRLHVYAIKSPAWNASKLSWNNAPLLDQKEALLHGVGTTAWVAGELAFDTTSREHWLDVTDIVKQAGTGPLTLVLIRETRQLGDDEDKGHHVTIQTGASGPELILFTSKP